MNEIVNLIINTYYMVKGNSNHFLLFGISLFALILWNHKHNKKLNLFLILYSLLFVFIYACPITAKIIADYCIGQLVYWRMFWILPYVAIIAYVGVNIIFDMVSKTKKIIAFLGIVFIIATCGTNVYSIIHIDPSTGAAKIPNYIEAMCNEVLTHSTENDIEYVNIAVPGELTPYIRQYDASIHMPYGRRDYEHPLRTTIDSEELDVSTLNQLACNENCAYIVLAAHKAAEKSADLKKYGFSFISQADNYYLFYLDI